MGSLQQEDARGTALALLRPFLSIHPLYHRYGDLTNSVLVMLVRSFESGYFLFSLR